MANIEFIFIEVIFETDINVPSSFHGVKPQIDIKDL